MDVLPWGSGLVKVYLPFSGSNDKPKIDYIIVHPGKPMSLLGLFTDHGEGLWAGAWVTPKKPPV